MGDSPPKKASGPYFSDSYVCPVHGEMKESVVQIQERIDMLERDRRDEIRNLESKLNTLVLIVIITCFFSGGSLLRDILMLFLKSAPK